MPLLGWRSFIFLCLLVGALLRAGWIADVEYKDDEDQLFQYSQAIPATQLWPAIGTTSGVRDLRHPSFGVWVLAFMAQLFGLHTPLAVTLSVAVLSLATLGLLFWFAARRAPGPEREVWLWTAALASVNLVATIYARKIWIPSLLPAFCVVILIAWSFRHTRRGALVWGIAGALVGQAHMTGFFYAGAVLTGTVLFARSSVRWRAWFAGSAWGAIPALPWFHYLWLNLPALQAHASSSPWKALDLGFFRTAFEISVGQTAEYNLGSHFQEYLAYPLLFGAPTHLVSVARYGLIAIGMVALVAAIAGTVWKRVRSGDRPRVTDDLLILFHAALTGIAMSAAGVPNSPHHHLMVFPLEYLWLPMAAIAFLPRPRLWLAAVWLGSAVCTLGFLQLIHQHCGAPNGDYGIAYRCQDKSVARTPGAGPTGGWSPALEALIRPGQEDVVARMLGRGEALTGSCRLVSGQIDKTFAAGTYACGDGDVTVRLVHRSKAPTDALRAGDFGVVLTGGSPPPGFVESIAERVRSEASRFEWLLEAGPTRAAGAAIEPGLETGYLPVLTGWQVLLRLLGGAVLLLVTLPWWSAGRTASLQPRHSRPGST